MKQKITILVLLFILGLISSAEATIVFQGSAYGINAGLPTDGSTGALTMTRPATAKPGMALIISIAARPHGMTWTAPPGWTQLSVVAEQPNGGVSTSPGGMTMRTYYRIVGISEPNSYTWTFANTLGAGPNGGGSAVGGLLVFSGIDTSTNPIDGTPTSLLTLTSTLTHRTTPVTTTVNNDMLVSVISYLSSGSFKNPTCSPITVAINQSAPTADDAIGTTVQMSYFAKATPGISCAPSATAFNYADYGLGHLLALRPSLRDLSLDMIRNVPLSPGGVASYTLTVSNQGGLSEPGPLSIFNTLPTGLNLASSAGSGWTCTTAGQVVTCTKTGALAAGASATPLVLNVNVGSTANGVLTNSATVSGTGGDSNLANNTDVDTYVIPATAYAYYPMDETTGATSFTNASGGANATALGTAATTGNPPATVGAAIAGSPGTCGAVRIPSGTTAIGVNTGIDVNTLGNAGTITFWYAGSTSWNDGTARMLFDASRNQGSGKKDKHFFLAKDGLGRLVFALENTSDTDATAATSSSYTYSTNTWHHLAVTWDLASGHSYVYLDGNTNPMATSTITGTLGDMDTLYLGAQRSTQVSGAPNGYTSNTANGYIDEVRLYNRALTPLEIEAVYNLTHACAATVDHFELSLPTASNACSATVVSVTACADTSSPCTNRQAAENGKLATLATNAGTLGTTSVVFDAIGVANTTLNYPTAATGAIATVTLSGEQLPTGQSTVIHSHKCCPNGINCIVANSCSTTFTACSTAAANFNIVDSDHADKGYDSAPNHHIYTKLAATSFALDVIALKSDGVTTETNYVGSGVANKNVKLELFDDSSGTACNSSASACLGCTKTVVATINPIIFTSTNAGYQNDITVALSSTNAYSRLVARITDMNATPTVYGCSSDTFSVRPQFFTVTATTSGGIAMTNAASGPSGIPAIKTGSNFILSADTATVGYNGTPKLLTSGVSDYLGSTTANLLSGSFNAANSITGKASGTFNYNEVGYFVLATEAIYDDTYTNTDIINGDCVGGSTTNTQTNGKYGCNIGSTGTSWGRFIPDHFVISNAAIIDRADINTGSTETTPSNFTYLGEDVNTIFTLTATAVNASGITTGNYTGSYAKLDLTSYGNFGFSASAGGAIGQGSVAPSGNWAAGSATVTATHQLPRSTTTPNGPFSAVNLSVTPIDSDTVTGTGSLGSTDFRYGRLWLGNTYGSENLDLSIPYELQYWNGYAFVKNNDSVQPFTATNISLTNYQGLTASNLGSSHVSLGAVSNGVRSILLTKPSLIAVGSVDLFINLGGTGTPANCPGYIVGTSANKSYLNGKWCGNLYDRDPVIRATFGIFGNSSKKGLVFFRENY